MIVRFSRVVSYDEQSAIIVDFRLTRRCHYRGRVVIIGDQAMPAGSRRTLPSQAGASYLIR